MSHITSAFSEQCKIDTGKTNHRISNRKLLICIKNACSVSKLGNYKVNILQTKNCKEFT